MAWGDTMPRIRDFNPWRRPDVNTLAPVRRRSYPAPEHGLASGSPARDDPETARGHRYRSGSEASGVPALTRCNDLRKGFL